MLTWQKRAQSQWFLAEESDSIFRLTCDARQLLKPEPKTNRPDLQRTGDGQKA